MKQKHGSTRIQRLNRANRLIRKIESLGFFFPGVQLLLRMRGQRQFLACRVGQREFFVTKNDEWQRLRMMNGYGILNDLKGYVMNGKPFIRARILIDAYSQADNLTIASMAYRLGIVK